METPGSATGQSKDRGLGVRITDFIKDQCLNFLPPSIRVFKESICFQNRFLKFSSLLEFHKMCVF